MRPIVSVIVPAYNSGSSIQRCIESIQKQTIETIEIIIVDDGSVDDTRSLCHAIIEADKRVSYVYQSNAGPYIARMTGIDRANGRYITFVDSDDTIKADTLEVMLALMNESIDVVVLESTYDAELTVEEYAKCLLSFKFLSVWGKLFRRELFINKAKNDIPSIIKVGEDFLMNLKTLENIKGKVSLRKINKYSYNANSKNSIQRTQKFDYDYEKTMVIHVESIITRLPFYQTLRHTLFQWKMTYLSGMIANNYQVLYDDDWIVALLKEADKERLSLRNRITIRAVNGNTFLRLILVQCRSLKNGIRTLLYR